MVASADHFIFSVAWWTDNFNSRFSLSSVYLCNILKIFRSTDLSLCYIIHMSKKNKILVKKKKKRIPVPQKPPKVERNPKAYDRDEEKKKIKKRIKEDLNSNG